MTVLKEVEVSDEVPTVPSKIVGALLMSLCTSPFCHTWRWRRAETFETHPEGSSHHLVVRHEEVRHEEAHHEEVHRREVQREVILNDAICTTIRQEGVRREEAHHEEVHHKEVRHKEVHHEEVRREEAHHEEVHRREVQQEVITNDAICTTILLRNTVEGNSQRTGLRKRRKMPQPMTTLRT
jgi:hypothetical protein